MALNHCSIHTGYAAHCIDCNNANPIQRSMFDEDKADTGHDPRNHVGANFIPFGVYPKLKAV